MQGKVSSKSTIYWTRGFLHDKASVMPTSISVHTLMRDMSDLQTPMIDIQNVWPTFFSKSRLVLYLNLDDDNDYL